MSASTIVIPPRAGMVAAWTPGKALSRVVFVAFLCAAASPGAAQIPDSSIIRGSLEEMFGDTVTVTPSWVVLEPGEMDSVAAQSKSPMTDDTLRVYTCRAGERLVGYGIADNVMGKSRFITYMVGLLPSGEVAGTEILVYRESHGGAIANRHFREQFTGKKPGDRLIPGRDVKIISGATISSRAVTYGVEKLLAAFRLVRKRP